MSAVWRAARAAVRRRRMQTFVIGLVVLLGTTTIVVALALLEASSAPFDRALAKQRGPHAVAVFDLLRRLKDERGLAVLLVTHDVNLAALHCDRLVLLAQGTVLADGPPAAVLEQGLLERAFGARLRVERGAGGVPFVVPERAARPER